MRINIFAFGATALSFIQLVTASSSTAMFDNAVVNHDMASVNGKLSSSNVGSHMKRDSLLEGLLEDVKYIISHLIANHVPVLDTDFLELKEDNVITELLGLLGLSGDGGSSIHDLGVGNTDGNKDAGKLVKILMGDGDDDEGDYDSREDSVNDILIITQQLLCSEGTSIEFYDKDNKLSSNSGSCIKSDKHDINLIKSVINLLKGLLGENGVGLEVKDGEGLLGKVLTTVTKLVSCLLHDLLGDLGSNVIGNDNLIGVKREMLRRTLVNTVKARRYMN